jgi:hypothetical protein
MSSKQTEIKLRPTSKQNDNIGNPSKETPAFNNNNNNNNSNNSSRGTLTINKTTPGEPLTNKPPITISNQTKIIRNIETNKTFSRSFENPSVLTNKQDVNNNTNNNRNNLNFKPYYDQMTNQIFMNSIPNSPSKFFDFLL